ncbi:MAG: VOC family protein, partial [Sphaerochaetaceae bacterium]
LSYLGQTRIEIIENLEGDTIYTDFIAKHGYGLQHLGIYVNDIEKALEEAKKAGFSVIMEGGGFGLDGDGYFAYLDTENEFGISYELIQRPLKRHEPEEIYPPLINKE